MIKLLLFADARGESVHNNMRFGSACAAHMLVLLLSDNTIYDDYTASRKNPSYQIDNLLKKPYGKW